MGLRRAAPIALMAAGWSAPAAAASEDCRIVPPAVREAAVYAGFSEKRMCKAGLAPLWQGVPEGAAQVLRFTFTSGHALFFRTVTITALADGSGVVEVVGGGHGQRGVRSAWVDLRPVRRRLTAGEVAAITALATQSGTFDHAVGSWDSAEDGAIFLHCQILELELAGAAGYRFSSVNIGCNRPERLMPLVDAVIRLGDIGMVRGNWAGHR